MKSSKNSLGSKIFTVAFVILLVVLLIMAFIYVAAVDDFEKPEEAEVEIDDDVWNYDMDDLLAYFDELGIIDSDDKILMSTVGTENWICNGIDMIWWDVDNLEEGTEAYEYWYELQENDNLYIWYGTSIYMLTVNGPFAIHVNTTYPGDEAEVIEAFYAFPSVYSGAKTSAE